MNTDIQLAAGDFDLLTHGQPLRVRINNSQDAVILLADQYERLKGCIDFTEADPKAVYSLVAEVAPEDWEDISTYPHAEKL